MKAVSWPGRVFKGSQSTLLLKCSGLNPTSSIQFSAVFNSSKYFRMLFSNFVVAQNLFETNFFTAFL